MSYIKTYYFRTVHACFFVYKESYEIFFGLWKGFELVLNLVYIHIYNDVPNLGGVPLKSYRVQRHVCPNIFMELRYLKQWFTSDVQVF